MHQKESAVPYQSIVPIFFEPDLRAQLTSKVRYERYMVNESQEYFANLLGPDVRFVSHPGVTFNITKDFVTSQNKSDNPLSETEISQLLTTALVHDWGELKLGAEGHGDITFEDHLESHESAERIIFQRISERIPITEDRSTVREVNENIAQNRESKLGRIFNVIERIGYLKTAFRAFIGVKGERIKNWAGLTGNVLSNQIIPLLQYEKDYPYVKEILSANKGTISDAFNKINKMRIMLANDQKKSFDRGKFRKNKTAWMEAKNNL